MIGEALDPVHHFPVVRFPRFFMLTNRAGFAGASALPGLNLTDGGGNPLPPRGFVLFSHQGSVDLCDECNDLNTVVPSGDRLSDRDQFKKLNQNLLNRCSVGTSGTSYTQ
jgi:hypothetical protein